MKVRYKGSKFQISVHLPIGCKNRSAIGSVITFSKEHDFSDEDAKALVALDPNNFELVDGEPTTKKRGRPKKEQLDG